MTEPATPREIHRIDQLQASMRDAYRCILAGDRDGGCNIIFNALNALNALDAQSTTADSSVRLWRHDEISTLMAECLTLGLAEAILCQETPESLNDLPH